MKTNSLEELMEKSKDFLKSSSKSTSVFVGCDSIVHKDNSACYAIVVVFHLDSNHGCKMFSLNMDLPDYGNMSQRLMMETTLAIQVTSEMIPLLEGRRLELHLDLNSNNKYKSNSVMKQAAGFVSGSLGIEAKFKPFAWAASVAADRVVR